jgi:hypothetical protein
MRICGQRADLSIRWPLGWRTINMRSPNLSVLLVHIVRLHGSTAIEDRIRQDDGIINSKPVVRDMRLGSSGIAG